MLTNAYYYKLYRPYILGSRDKNDVTHRRAKIAEATPQARMDRGMVFVLNKSLKSEIVRYARSVSQGVTQFKTTVHSLSKDMGNFGLNAMYNGYDSALQLVEDGLYAVAEAYNTSTGFLERQQQSESLRSYSHALRDKMEQGRDLLGMLGVSFGVDDDSMVFDPSVLQELSQIELHVAIGSNLQVFHSLHQSATEVLVEPLSVHMGFKGLSYHYNYQLGRMVEDGFGIIESGMIIDRVV